MTEDRKTADRNDPGVLPDGVRGTTRDIGATIPQDEHAGHGEPSQTLSEADRRKAAEADAPGAVPPSGLGSSASR